MRRVPQWVWPALGSLGMLLVVAAAWVAYGVAAGLFTAGAALILAAVDGRR